MLKKSLLTLSLVAALVSGALAGETHYVHGEIYYVSFSNQRLESGRYKHIMRASLLADNEPNISLTSIACNGDGNGDLYVTDSDGVGIFSVDYSSDARWTWNADN
jgi:hypothetical protein